VVYNGFEDSVNVSVKPDLEPMELMWSNYTRATLDPGSSTRFTWIIRVPRSLGFGNYTLGFNITYTLNSTVYSMYKETQVQVIPRNISLLVADLMRNSTGYYLVISNPLMDPGQYIVENVTVTITAYNMSVVPREAFVKRLYANSSYIIPLAIDFTDSDIGALLVNITANDDVHGLVYFNYTFIVFNATAHLDLLVINDCGEPLPGAIVRIGNGTYNTDSSGLVSLVLPVGIYNYTVEYLGHTVSGTIAVYTGYNMHIIVVDVSPPVIVSIEQRGYGLIIRAYDPHINASGIALIKVIQGNRVWDYRLFPRRNVTAIIYPPIEAGDIVVEVVDAKGNTVNSTYTYRTPPRGNPFYEAVIVLLVSAIILIAILLVTRTY